MDSVALDPLPPSDAVRKKKKYFRGSSEFNIVTIFRIALL